VGSSSQYGCVYYDEEAEEMEIKMELQEEDKYEYK